MIDWSRFPSHILPRLQNHSAMKDLRRQPIIFSDTSDFTRIDYGDIIHVDNRYFLVVGYTKEGRFGIDEQPKQWVPKVVDLESGERKILKLVFHENFTISLGQFQVTCYRTPEKEARVLDLVKGNPLFMQGYSTLDEAGNLVRILDVIQGTRLDTSISRLACDDEGYMANHLEGILRNFLQSMQAILLLHQHGFKHGDIRRDHIIVDGRDGLYRWIDFDYDFYLPERPFALDLIGLGNTLLFILGRRNYRPIDVLEDPEMGEKVLESLHVDDLALLSQDRIFNLQKLKPKLPKCFNDILLHFSAGTPVLYDTAAELYEDLDACITQVYG
jgi:hypothetical protein